MTGLRDSGEGLRSTPDDDGSEAFEGTLMDGLEDEPPYPPRSTPPGSLCALIERRGL